MLTKFIHQYTSEAPEFDPDNGDYYWVTDNTKGGASGGFTEAAGDGSTDDRAAIQSCINAASSAGKKVYFPAGTYRMDDAADPFLTLPDNMELRGVGDTSILRFDDDGTDDRRTGLDCKQEDGIAIKYLKLMGTQTNKEASVILINASGATNLLLDHVTGDGAEYFLRFNTEATYGTADEITINDCVTLSNVLNPFYLSWCTDVYVNGGTFDANTVDCMAGRYPHHFYINDSANRVYVDGVTLTNGQRECIDIHSDGGTAPINIEFTDLTLTNVIRGIWVQDSTYVTINGLTASSNRFSNGGSEGCWLLLVTDADYVTMKNFTITGSANTDYLVCVWATTGTHNLLQDGSITNCDNYSSTPRGLYVDTAGQYPEYDNVSVNGTTVNYP